MTPRDWICTPDDRQWGLDHFYRKLLRIPEHLHTETARRIARERGAFMRAFLEQLAREVEPATGLPGQGG